MIKRVLPSQNLVALAATAIAYYWLYQINAWAFSHFEYSYGVTWIFLPSGFRLVFALVFGLWGALGIGLATLFMAYQSNPAGDLIAYIGTSLVSGGSTLLALWISRMRFRLDILFDKLTGVTLIKMAGIFAMTSSSMHQFWYLLRGQTDNFFSSLAVMMIGDLLGTMIMLYLAKIIIFGISARLPCHRAK